MSDIEKATIVIRNASIYTIDENNTTANSIAICGDTIAYVGEKEDVDIYIGDKTNVIDLNGEMVLPGFIDGHIHAGIEQVIRMYCLDLREVIPSVEQYRKTIRNYLDEHKNVEFIFGVGFQYTAFNGQGPKKEMLDELCEDIPIYISDISLHALWVNSLGLKTLGIDKNTIPTKGGLIVKDERDQLTGELSDCFNIMEIWQQNGISKKMFLEAFKQLEKDCAEKGITSINSMGTIISGKELWNLIKTHEESGEMRIRANFSVDCMPNQEVETVIDQLESGQVYSSDMLNVKSAKIFLDGTPEGKTAFLLEPYSNNSLQEKEYRGDSLWTYEQLKEVVSKIDAAGFQVHMHAIGDAAVREAIDSIEYSMRKNGVRDARHTIAHVCLIKEDDVDRMSELGIYAAIQPIWAYADSFFSDLEITSYGEERYESEYPFKDMIDKGVCLVGSADNPVSENRPLSGIQVGVTRSSPYGAERYDNSFERNKNQAVSAIDMIRAYTINGAKEMFMDNKIGSIEVGKKADITILTKDLTQIDPKEIVDTEIVGTVFNGEFVYDKIRKTC